VACPAVVGVLRHPTAGVVLFDTGYTPRFFDETRRMPYAAYRRLLPVRCDPEQTVAAQLPGIGLDPGDVSMIVVSHFHADHIGGLGDFPSARFTYLRAGLDHVRRARGALGNLRNAFLPGHLPADFDDRAQPADRAPRVRVPGLDGRVGEGFDLLGDGSLIGVDLSGHVPGQLGLYLPHTQGPPVLFAGDACWNRRAFTDMELPHPVVRLLTHDHRQYLARIGDLRRLAAASPELVIVPSHCPDSLAMARRALEP
jgi:glyoxylase-like metal-dependent hydrolase (beta-lactamase superfamily II)